MHIVDDISSDTENKFKIVEKIPVSIIEQLKKVYSSNNFEISDEIESAKYLLRVKENKYWILCDCRDSITNPVIMCIKQRQSNKRVYFGRVPSYVDHHSTQCSFYRISNEYTADDFNFSVEKENFEFFGMFKPTSGIASNQISIGDKESKSKSKKDSIGSLGKRLLTLIDNAKLNYFRDEHLFKLYDNMSNEKNIYNSINSFYLSPKLPLKECFIFKDKFNMSHLVDLRKFLDSLDYDWSKYYKKQGFIMFTTDSIDKKNRLIKLYSEREIEYYGNLSFINGCVGKCKEKQDFLVLVILSADESYKSVRPEDVFAVPVLSKNFLIPLESYNERRVLEKMIRISRSLKKRNPSHIINIMKPVFNIHVDGEECRPDFILEYNTMKIVIEVMGFNDEIYLERKNQQKKIMSKIGPIVTFDCMKSNNEFEFERDLDALAHDIYEVTGNKKSKQTF